MSEGKLTTECEGCCPAGSHPKRPAGAHTPKGKYQKIDDLEVYVSGEAKSGLGLLLSPEVFGIKTGDLAELADFFAEGGYMVVMPDYFRGNYITDFSKFGDWVKKWPWSTVGKDADRCIDFLQKAGAKKIAGAGFCYGTWVNLHLSAEGKLSTIINMHPSHVGITGLLGEDVDKLIAAVKVPFLQFPAGNDPDRVKPGGTEEKTIKAAVGEKNVCFKEYKEMAHGWTTRGDRKDPKIAEQQWQAWCDGRAFLQTHFK